VRIKVLLAAFLFLVSGTFLLALEETRELDLSASGIGSLEIKCGAGFLKVEGKESRGDISAEAEIILKGRNDEKAQDYIDEYLRLTLEKKGDTAVLHCYFDSRFSSSSWRSKVINLTVYMPARLNLVINDSSGDMRIWGADGTLEIEDGSGSIEVEDQGGDVQIDDGSGGIEVTSVKGSIFIKDGSGSIQIEDITGNVKIDDGSGSITVRDVGGDFILLDDGSGGLSVSNVRGQVKKR
jgi:hypothetical protein